MPAQFGMTHEVSRDKSLSCDVHEHTVQYRPGAHCSHIGRGRDTAILRRGYELRIDCTRGILLRFCMFRLAITQTKIFSSLAEKASFW